MDHRNVEDIFRLTPLQQSLLGHHLQRPSADSGLLQIRQTLEGDLDRDRFEESWRRVIARHPALRSSIHWKDLSHPVQVVSRQAGVRIRFEDWGACSEADRGARLARFLADQRGAGIDLNAAPAMRLALLRTAPQEHVFVWTCHHALLDGWSGAIVLEEVFACYDAQSRGVEFRPAPGPSFKEFAASAASRRSDLAERFWRERFHVRPDDSRLARQSPPGPARAPRIEMRRASLDAIAPADLESWSRRHHLPPNSLFLGCWSLLLAHRLGGTRPVFGVTVSGRAAGIAGIDRIVGMFANTLPFVLDVQPSHRSGSFFESVFRELRDLQRFDQDPLGHVLQWAGLPSTHPPFDSILVYTNFPGAARLEDGGDLAPVRAPGAISLRRFRGDVTSSYPLTVVVIPGAPFRIEARYDRDLFTPREIDAILRDLESLLHSVIRGRALLGDILRELPAASQPGEDAAPPPRPDSGEPAPPAPSPIRSPAANAIEAQLMRIWDDFLDVKQIGRDDNFFELGGHSLVLPRLLDRIRRDFGVELPIGSIFGAPTITSLAGLIEARHAPASWPCLVGIRETGALRPLHLVHGLGGEIGYYYNLAGSLDPEQPLYALQAPVDPFPDIVEMARHYLSEIRAVQPAGPYRIGGYCLGGSVAFEMARQLQSAGEEIEVLVIIDAVSPTFRPPAPRFAKRTAQRLRRVASERPAVIIKKITARTGRTLRRLAGHDPLPGEAPIRRWQNVPEAFWDISNTHAEALLRYEPGPFHGDASLLRSATDRFPPDLDWHKLIDGKITVTPVEGPHSDILKDPFLPGTARKLSAILDRL